MAEMKETLTDYAIGAVAGIAIYHYVLRKEYPSVFPTLNSNSINSVDQIAGIDLNALMVCRQNGIM